MSPRGGKRDGAGRPSRGLPTTKVTVYKETHELLKKYSEEMGIPIVELLYSMVKDYKITVKQ